MKITEEIKQSPTFIFAKMKGLNNRESARFCTIISEGIDNKRCGAKAIDVYLKVCKEPKIDVMQYDWTLVKEGVEKKSRSKLVMEYEKHRKAFIKIKEARHTDQLLDNLVHEKYDELVNSDNIRMSVLSSYLLTISR